MIRSVLACWSMLCLAGCQAPGDDPPAEPAAPVTQAGGAPIQRERGMDLEAQVAAAVADLAERTGVAPGSIERLEARHVTWPDSSLGCPLPGLMYMQVLTPGTLIRLRAAGVEYRYHARTGGGPLLCPAARATGPVPGAVER